MGEEGLRARKKAKTRLAISDTATKMFHEWGFDAVTVADIAAAAEVSVATVFNYFPTKEDMFFEGERTVIDAHVRLIRERKRDESIPEALERAVRDALDDALGWLLSDGGRFVRTLQASPSLRARAHLSLEKLEMALTKAIAEETSATKSDPSPRVVAALFVTIERALVDEARAAILRGDAAPVVKRHVRRTCERAFELLGGGIRGYGRADPTD